MRVIAYLLLPALSSAFAPVRPLPSTRSRGFGVSVPVVDDVCSDVVEATEDVIGKVDSSIISRAMRFVDHAPVIATLMHFGKATSTKFGVGAAPEVFAAASSSPALLSIPSCVFKLWPLISIYQLASVARSALNANGSELSQREISTLAVSNVAAAKTLTSDDPLKYMILTAILSGSASRSSGSGDLSLHSGALQLMSSLTTVLALLGTAAQLPAWIPFFSGKEEVTATIGVALYYILATREGNGKIKRAVNFGVIGGILWSRVAAGGIALTRDSLLSVSLLGTAFVAYTAFDKLKKAL